MILTNDHAALSQALQHLTHAVDVLSHTEKHFKHRIKTLQEADKRDMLQDELLGPIQQRSIEVHQQLLIARQAVMTLELIIKQNKTLIRDIDQTVMTTTAALDVAAGIAMAKHNQNQHKHAIHIDTDKLQQAKSSIEATLAHLNEVNQGTTSASNSLESSKINQGRTF